jgi:hypothetical protein
MRNMSNLLPVVLLIGMALAAGAFILSVPPLFRPHEQHQVWITGTLGCLSLVLAVGTLYLRHSPTRR